MCAPTAVSLRDALNRALKLFADKPRMAAVQARDFARDFSWTNAASVYEKLYQDSL
jgi:starch synthase